MSGGQHACFVSGISSATGLLFSCFWDVLRQLLLSPLIGQRESESEREKEREGKREEWDAMDSGIAFLGWGGSKDQDFYRGILTVPFTDLSEGGDTTISSQNWFSLFFNFLSAFFLLIEFWGIWSTSLRPLLPDSLTQNGRIY